MAKYTKGEKAIRAAAAGAVVKNHDADFDDLLARICGGPTLPTQRDFILAPDRVGWYVGPVGSGKSIALVGSVLFPALLYPGSRWLVARATYWTLEETTLRAFTEACERVGPNTIIDRVKGPPYKLLIASALRNPDGTPAPPSEVLFYSLDNIEKLGSTQFTGIAVDEANEIDAQMAATLDSRLRWKLPSQTEPIGPFFLRFVSNPVRRSHWLHKKFCGESDCDPVPWGKKFRPSPRENAVNLPPGYYESIAAGMSPEMKLRLVEGECGPDPSGLAVFPEFTPGLHSSDALQWVKNSPMIRGWDFGRRRPACVIAQRTPEGWVNRLAAMLGDNESLESFGRKVMDRCLLQFPEQKIWFDGCDPHGVQKRDTSEETSVSILQKKFNLSPRFRDVSVETGLEAMSKGLSTLIKGRPRSMYHSVDCQLLVEGYSGGYVWPNHRPGSRMKDRPLADGFYEHLMDADRYIEVNLGMVSDNLIDLSAFKRTLRKKRA